MEIPIDFLAALGAFCENHAGTKLQFVGLIVDQEQQKRRCVQLDAGADEGRAIGIV